MKKTEIGFTRHSHCGIDRFLVASFEHDEALDTAERVLEAFERGVTDWVKTAGTGARLWTYSGGYLNIGDIANHCNDAGLTAAVAKFGIHSWDIAFEATNDNCFSYDRVLAAPDGDDDGDDDN